MTSKNFFLHNIYLQQINRIATTLALIATLSLPTQIKASYPEFALPASELPTTTANYSPLQYAQRSYQSDNYICVIDQLRQYLLNSPSIINSKEDSEQHLKSVYLLALSAYNLDEPQTTTLLSDFTAEYPESPFAKQTLLALADYYFFQHQYDQALKAYNQLSEKSLLPYQRDAFTYRKALCMIQRGFASDARHLLKTLLNSSEYANAAQYYDAYIDYTEGDLNSAYDKFMRVNAEKDIEPGYYITQIEYSRGEYNNAIKHGKSLIKKRPVEDLLSEINHIIGMSYFKLILPDNAYPYLEYYLNKAGESAATDAQYAFASILYQRGDYQRAEQYFQNLTDQNNDLAQSAWLYIGQCQAHRNNYNAAALSFEKAARMTFDKQIAETAAYNLIAARNHGGNIPFRSNVEMLEKFLRDYPTSKYAEEVTENLAVTYYNEKDFKKAIESIDKTTRLTPQLKALKQKIQYELGIKLLGNSQPDQAAIYLEAAAQNNRPDQQLAANASLWLGDALYESGQLQQAANAYNNAIHRLPDNANKTLAQYNLAYAYYMQNDFKKAARQFEIARKQTPKLPTPLYNDALLRQADCLFYSGDYKSAQTLYAQARSSNTDGADYAAYREALIAGATGRYEDKIQQLLSFSTLYPDSKWMPEVLLETGTSYAQLNKTAKAIETLNQLRIKFPTAAQTRNGLLQLANLYSTQKNTTEAKQAYQQLIKTWPDTNEAENAHNELTLIYASEDNLDKYAEFLANIPGAPRLDNDNREKLTFNAAFDAIENDNNTTLMEAYINRYPTGKYIDQALMLTARNNIDNKNYESAIQKLQHLITISPNSAHTPEALMLAAEISELQLPNRKNEALSYWLQLENKANKDLLPKAYLGIMRNANNDKTILIYAEKIKKLSGLSTDTQDEATLLEAHALMNSGNKQQAIDILNSLKNNPQTISGSKAAVALAQYYLDNRQYKKAEQILLDFTSSATPHNYWLARGFITLADTYQADKQTALAKEYLLSLKENYPGKNDDILDLINSRLKKLSK